VEQETVGSLKQAGAKRRVFYGWWIVAAGFVVTICGAGVSRYISADPQSTLEALAGATGPRELGPAMMLLGLASLAGSTIALAGGPLVDRHGPRRAMLIGIPLAGISVMALGAVNSLPMYYVLQGALLTIGMQVGFHLPVVTATANWFIRRRSLALAIVSTAALAGVLIFGRLGELASGGLGRQGAFLVLGATMLVVGVALAFVIKHRPEQHGYLPDGRLPEESETEQVGSDMEADFTPRQDVRTRAFWLLAAGVGLSSQAGWTLLVARLEYWREFGTDPAALLGASDTSRLVGIAVILLFGYLGDGVPKRYLLALVVTLQVVSAIAVVALVASASTALSGTYAFSLGMASGMVPLALAIRADYFGRRSFATVTAVASVAVVVIGAPLGAGLAALSGWMATTTEDIWVSIIPTVVMGVVAAGLFLVAKPPRRGPQGKPHRRWTPPSFPASRT
jgi:MFS family permease